MENTCMRLNMNKTKVMISGECQKLIQWILDLCYVILKERCIPVL